jgi:dolichyl-diphosphooligosaccharide--protein glycosyltransferase
MLALAPGHFLMRSALGYTDHHILEVLLGTAAMLLLMVALERGDAGADDARGASPLWWAALAGLALAGYLIAWASGAFLVFVLWAWLLVQCALDGVRRRSSAPVLRGVLPMLAVALGVVLLLQDWERGRTSMKVTVLAGALGTAVLLALLERAVARRRGLRLLVPAVIAALLVAGVALFARLAPHLYGALVREIERLRAVDPATVPVEEALPLLAFPLWFTWDLFGSSLVLGLAALPLLAYRVLARPGPSHALMLVWSLAMLAVTLRQNRFGYYLAFNLAVLSGHLCAMALDWSAGGGALPAWGRAAMGTILAAIAVVVPNAGLAVGVASQNLGVPPARHAALAWLRRESPEPFQDADYYFAPYDPWGRPGSVRRPAYTVMTWWDYGYDVIRIARRPPTSNPTQGGAWETGRFFLATDERAGTEILRQVLARYVMMTEDQLYLPRSPGRVVSSFPTMAHWAVEPLGDFVEQAVERRPDGGRVRILLFRPAYYQTMASRLYLFDGRAVTPENSTWVVTYGDGPRGGREIVESRRFATHGDAERYLRGRPPGRHALVGRDPLRSPVPLPALRHYVLIHDSADGRTRYHGLPTVKIFEFTPSARPVAE